MWDRQSHRAPTPGLGRHTGCPVIIQPTPVMCTFISTYCHRRHCAAHQTAQPATNSSSDATTDHYCCCCCYTTTATATPTAYSITAQEPHYPGCITVMHQHGTWTTLILRYKQTSGGIICTQAPVQDCAGAAAPAAFWSLAGPQNRPQANLVEVGTHSSYVLLPAQ
jgi:hypothetical protein